MLSCALNGATGMKTNLKIQTIRETPDYAVIALRGEATFADTDEMKAVLLGAAEPHGRRGLILDCTELTYLDSSGLGVIVAVHTTFKRKQGRLILAGMQPGLTSILDVSRLRKVIPVKKNLEEAAEDMEGFLASD